MTKVVTLTPNPALDIATHVERLLPFHKLRCGPVRRDPGGGGVNVARVVHRLGGDVVAVYASGGGSGEELQEMLRRESVQQRPVQVAGHTRESFNITEDQTNEQFRFVLPGDPLREIEWRNCIDTALALLASGDYFVGSGGLPPDVPTDFYARVLRAAKAKGSMTVIDTHGAALKSALDEGVDILKASTRELGEFLGAMPSDPKGWRDACRGLLQSGKVQTIAVSMGEKGAVLATKKNAWHVAVPQIRPMTTVGAGDSFLGGLLVKLIAGRPLPEALTFASAAGTAALVAHGTGLCDPAEVAKLNEGLSVREL
jgi:6-phosphofructokinase 2